MSLLTDVIFDLPTAAKAQFRTSLGTDPRVAVGRGDCGHGENLALKDVAVLRPLEFITATEAVELSWHVREGLLGILGKMRPQGSMVITEDVCSLPQQLRKARTIFRCCSQSTASFRASRDMQCPFAKPKGGGALS